MKKYSSSINAFNKASVIIALSIILGTVTYAWTGPTGTAPNSNAPAPINVSANAQTKSGPFSLMGAFTISGGYKGYSALTTAGDDQSTMVTKSYVDANKIKVYSAHNVMGTACLGTFDGGFCSGLFYVDVVFPSPFSSTPHVIVTPENLSNQSGCVGGATDKVVAQPSSITRNGFRLYISGSPVGSGCGTYEGWSTYGTASWLAIGN